MITQAIILGDCLAVVRTMPTSSLHTAVFSPPYNLGKRYGQYSDSMPEREYLA
jgi:adenine-specific DNA-methyltransferase